MHVWADAEQTWLQLLAGNEPSIHVVVADAVNLALGVGVGEALGAGVGEELVACVGEALGAGVGAQHLCFVYSSLQQESPKEVSVVQHDWHTKCSSKQAGSLAQASLVFTSP
jgi:hypothetical protein